MSTLSKKEITGNSLYIVIVASIAATGGLLFGFDTGNISGALQFIHIDFHTSEFQDEAIVSITVIAALLGALVSGWLANQFGRRMMLIIAALLFIFGAVYGAYSQSVLHLLIGRSLLGFAIGISSYTVPLYISEVSPPEYRGALVLLNGIAITGGEAIAFLIDYFFANSGNWRMMILVGVIPAIVLLLGMIFMPMSPRWALLKGNHERSLEILRKLRGYAKAKEEFFAIKSAQTSFKSHFFDLFSKRIRPVIYMAPPITLFFPYKTIFENSCGIRYLIELLFLLNFGD